MGMASIAGKEYTVVLVEVVCVTLPNGICRPPNCLNKIDLIWLQNVLCLTLEVFQCDLLRIGSWSELDVEASQVVAITLSGDDQDIACLGANGGLFAEVREVCSRNHVHDTPDCIATIANHFVPKCFSNDAMGSITCLRSC